MNQCWNTNISACPFDKLVLVKDIHDTVVLCKLSRDDGRFRFAERVRVVRGVVLADACTEVPMGRPIAWAVLDLADIVERKDLDYAATTLCISFFLEEARKDLARVEAEEKENRK